MFSKAVMTITLTCALSAVLGITMVAAQEQGSVRPDSSPPGWRLLYGKQMPGVGGNTMEFGSPAAGSRTIPGAGANTPGSGGVKRYGSDLAVPSNKGFGNSSDDADSNSRGPGGMSHGRNMRSSGSNTQGPGGMSHGRGGMSRSPGGMSHGSTDTSGGGRPGTSTGSGTGGTNAGLGAPTGTGMTGMGSNQGTPVGTGMTGMGSNQGIPMGTGMTGAAGGLGTSSGPELREPGRDLRIPGTMSSPSRNFSRP